MMLIVISIAFITDESIAGRANCYRMLDIDASTASSDTLELAFNGSGEVALLAHITGYTHSGTAAQIYFYTEVQDSLYPLQLNVENTAVVGYISIADGYKRGAASFYAGIGYPVAMMKVFGEKLHIAYIKNDSTAGHITLDVCIRKED